MSRVDSGIEKVRGKHLALAARITVANGLILSTIWYMITLWAGEMAFLHKIQKKIEAFVWAGRPRVDRNTISQGRARGGLGLLSVIEQYRAMSGNLMTWILGPEPHPLRVILTSHIRELSKRKWGVPGLSWVVTKGGSSESFGSPPWQNICRAWGALKPLLRKLEPRNQEEWEMLPLWRPHHHHLSETKVQCTSLAQHRLREAGLLTVGDISEANGQISAWESLPVNQDDLVGRRAYTALVANIRHQAFFDIQPGPHQVYCGEARLILILIYGRIWLYDVPQQQVSSRWPIIRDAALPISTFRCRAGMLSKITRCCPPNNAILHRVLIRQSEGSTAQKSHFGSWSQQRNLLLQYKWSDGTAFLDTCTSQLRSIQALQRLKPHKVAVKWERELGRGIPAEIWRETWLNFRGANENTFLWQMYFRAIATQRWRFPSLPADDPQIRCSRCNLGAKEDILHCVWGCPLSQPCWQWGTGILIASSERRNRIGGLRGSIEPSHVFLAAPLPADWQVPGRIWHILRAVISWQVWKSRNEHYMANRPTDPRRTIRKAWHRFSMYLRKEWLYLRRKISNGRLSLAEAESTMQANFGTNHEIWGLHGLTIHVPPRPP